MIKENNKKLILLVSLLIFVILFFMFNKPKYTLTIKYNNSLKDVEVELKHKEKYELEEITKDGYIFDEWEIEGKNSKIMEGSFKLFFNDDTGESQYGGFDYMYYGDEVNRSYEWKVLKNRQVYVLEYNADEPDAGLEGAFFRNTPISTSLHWKTP